ncbi:MAG: glucosidase [Flammeovirgaceae bacterium]|jgi:hypothetical protein|nr:glucosidase [Flammeovirgaceae bacterium]|tara:strand:+ start:16770 stop:19412 length:2643 start_codon:yes stop_codon:yes gene_type:complete
MKKTEEQQRIDQSKNNKSWKSWGPYLSERQWATVREDYTPDGNVWNSVSHDMARSKAFRWGEDGIGGFSNEDQRICFSWAFWNHKDPILKERLFGLTSHEGNHGEDVKELYYYSDSTPTHSYMKMLYKYPINRFPYEDLVITNSKRTKDEPEYELMDTGIFDHDEYFDIFMNYGKANVEDFLFEAEIHNRSGKAAELDALPTVWFRNTWSSGRDRVKPKISDLDGKNSIINHHLLGNYYLYFDDSHAETVYCDNETNRNRMYDYKNSSKYTKDGINDFVIKGKASVNPNKSGTKASGIFRLNVPAKSMVKVKIRLSKEALINPFDQFDTLMNLRISEANEFYDFVQKDITNTEHKSIQRQAFAGMMWSKQFYYYNVKNWLKGDPGKPKPPKSRLKIRNQDWQHLYNYAVISMPDKWEYPWYASWDLAFHTIPIARIDPDFAKEQLLLLLQERYQHPNGQIPAYEWNFNDVNPPVHGWAVQQIFDIDKAANHGVGDYDFLMKAFHKLLVNFTWWVNRKDSDGNNIFSGGFLGLDNIGVFDRNHPIVEHAQLSQADSTSWMAMFSLNMLNISLELSLKFNAYQDMATKFFEHFLHIAGAMNSFGEDEVNLWDETDNFYYDVISTPENPSERLRIRSIVGLIPLFAVEVIKSETFKLLPEFNDRLNFFLKERPELGTLVSRWEEEGSENRRLLSIMRGFRMKKVLDRMLDESEFLSEYGIRALSKHHEQNPFVFEIEDQKLEVKYLPGESDSSFFGGNSNWRGPIWFPMNHLLIESLMKFHTYYGPDFKIEYPKGSGVKLNLKNISEEIALKLINIFMPDASGNRPMYGSNEKMQKDPHFKNHLLFYEYFHGDSGLGLGASHQTGWTGLIAEIIHGHYQNIKE